MKQASREAEIAINVAADAGFTDLILAARAVPKAPLESGVDYTVRDWIEFLRDSAGPSWRKMEMAETVRRWKPPPRVHVAIGRKVKVVIEAIEATEHLARAAATSLLKAEKRCSSADLARGVKWLKKQPASYWTGVGKVSAFRRCDPTSAYDWYVLLIVEMHQELGIEISGFNTDPKVHRDVRAKRRGQ